MDFDQWLGKDNEIGRSIMERKYRRFGENWDAWLNRVSGGNEAVAKLIEEKKFLFGGRTMANRGIDEETSYFNCYSKGFVEDDFGEIMSVAKDLGLTFKAQGGQGLSLSKLRPKGTPVGKSYASDGIVPFMKLFNEVTAATSQGGARKGALMISIDARHKEAETFIRIKNQEGVVEKANLSLEIDDEFMGIIDEWMKTGSRRLIHEVREYSGHTVEYDVDPVAIFEALADNGYDWGDPAVLYVNRFRNYNLMQHVDDYQIETCNPCGEQPLPKDGACCLGAINLSEFVVDPYTKHAYFNTGDFVKAVQTGIEALDTLIDENAERHPLPAQKEMSLNYRNIGLGVMGYATMLMKLGMRYGSERAKRFTDNIFGLMFRSAVMHSCILAEQLGAFPKYDERIFDSDIIRAHFDQNDVDSVLSPVGIRNCSLLSVAPTGSIATMIGESGGCEPEFAIKYTRRTVGMTDGEDTYYDVYCKAAREYMEVNQTDVLPDYFVSSMDISWQDRIETQAIMQKHVDTAISSTVNLPNSATRSDIVNLYYEAWQMGLKGVTIFRDGCKRMPILSTHNDEDDKDDEDESILHRGEIVPVSDNVVGIKRKLTTGCGSLHCTAFFDPDSGNLLEVYLNKGSLGGCNNFMVGLSRMISLSARAGVSLADIANQLISSGVCPSYAVRKATKNDTSVGSSCPVAVGHALIEMYESFQNLGNNAINNEFDGYYRCPVCDSKTYHSGGCDICTSCGWSKCE